MLPHLPAENLEFEASSLLLSGSFPDQFYADEILVLCFLGVFWRKLASN